PSQTPSRCHSKERESQKSEPGESLESDHEQPALAEPLAGAAVPEEARPGTKAGRPANPLPATSGPGGKEVYACEAVASAPFFTRLIRGGCLSVCRITQ